MAPTADPATDPADPPPLDCLVVGAGPGGLTAATYLARFHRTVAVVDAGRSRARWIPTSHNCPGFPFGVSGVELLRKLRAQASQHGVAVEDGRVARLERGSADDAFRAVAEDGRAWRARCVVLATGVVDRMPAMHGLEEAIARNVLRLCAVCDGYEASDAAIAVHGPVDAAVAHALFLRGFSRQVAVVPSEPGEPSAERAAAARDAGIALLPPARSLALEGDGCVFALEDGTEHRCDTVYPALGSDPESALARRLDARLDAGGEVVVDARQQSAVDGLYAVGDVVSALNQISVAMGHAAVAATAIHNRLPRRLR